MEESEKQMEYIIDFVNKQEVSDDGELVLAYVPSGYTYMGSVYAGTGSKNRHRYEKITVTWRRKFNSADEARAYLASLNLPSHFEQDPILIMPFQKPFGIRRFGSGLRYGVLSFEVC